MNCQESERYILLAQSREIDADKAAAVDRHVEACAACRAYRQDVIQVMETAEKALLSGEPTGASLARIRETARRRSQPRIILFRPLTTQVFAYAAALMLVVAGWVMLHRNGRTAGTSDDQSLSDVGVVFACVQQTLQENTTDVAPGTESEIKALAQQLLRMERWGDDQSNDSRAAIEFEWPRTIGRQSRNTPAIREKRCV